MSDTWYGPEQFLSDIDVPRETFQALNFYADELVKWQRAKNLVANSTLEDRWRRHFLDSAQIAPLILQKNKKRTFQLLDIGSGAGFPGLVLSIMGLGSVELVESNGRKCVFMNQIARQTGADAVAVNKRIEDIPARPVDIITSRACAKVDQLLRWALPFLTEGTEMWLLKGVGAEGELTEALASWNMTVERFQSRSDPTGVILRLRDIKLK